jgi:hypothetical protein
MATVVKRIARCAKLFLFMNCRCRSTHRDNLCCGVERDWSLKIGLQIDANWVVNNKSLRGTEDLGVDCRSRAGVYVRCIDKRYISSVQLS